MKKIILSSITLASLLVIGLTLSSNASGPGGNRTGSPGSSGNCSGCHGGGNYGGTLKVGITEIGDTTFLSFYTPGKAYDMHVISGGTSTKKGFQATILTSSNAAAGTMSAVPSGTSIDIAGGKSIWGHTTPSSTGVWKSTWTAPTAGLGTVTIYGAAVVSNANGANSNDQVVTANAMIGEKVPSNTKSIEPCKYSGTFKWGSQKHDYLEQPRSSCCICKQHFRIKRFAFTCWNLLLTNYFRKQHAQYNSDCDSINHFL